MAGIFGHGTELDLGDGAVAQLTNISGPNFSADSIDVTDHDSEDRYREFIQGLRDGGEVSLEGNYLYAVASAVLTKFNTDANISDATITLPNGAGVFTFDCFVTGFSVGAPHDDKISFSATVKITGKPEFSTS